VLLARDTLWRDWVNQPTDWIWYLSKTTSDFSYETKIWNETGLHREIKKSAIEGRLGLSIFKENNNLKIRLRIFRKINSKKRLIRGRQWWRRIWKRRGKRSFWGFPREERIWMGETCIEYEENIRRYYKHRWWFSIGNQLD